MEDFPEKLKHEAIRNSYSKPIKYRIRPVLSSFYLLWAFFFAALQILFYAIGIFSLIGVLSGLVLAFFFAFIRWVSTYTTFQILNDRTLSIDHHGICFTEDIKNVELLEEERIDFINHRELSLASVFSGTNWPRFYGGWYSLKNGAIGFACLSKKRKAGVLKTKKGIYLLVDPRIVKKVKPLLRA